MLTQESGTRGVLGGEKFTKRHRFRVAGDLKAVVLENRNVFSERWEIGGRAFLPSTALIFPLLTFMNPFLYSNRYVSYPSSSVWFPRKEKEGRKKRKEKKRKEENFFSILVRAVWFRHVWIVDSSM